MSIEFGQTVRCYCYKETKTISCFLLKREKFTFFLSPGSSTDFSSDSGDFADFSAGSGDFSILLFNFPSIVVTLLLLTGTVGVLRMLSRRNSDAPPLPPSLDTNSEIWSRTCLVAGSIIWSQRYEMNHKFLISS